MSPATPEDPERKNTQGLVSSVSIAATDFNTSFPSLSLPSSSPALFAKSDASSFALQIHRVFSSPSRVPESRGGFGAGDPALGGGPSRLAESLTTADGLGEAVRAGDSPSSPPSQLFVSSLFAPDSVSSSGTATSFREWMESVRNSDPSGASLHAAMLGLSPGMARTYDLGRLLNGTGRVESATR